MSDRSGITVGVLISTYNRAEYLTRSLDSVLAQTRPADEIIVVDDGSTDATPEVAARYRNRIRYFRQHNQGKSSALNFAIPRAATTHIVIFDDDDFMLPDALESQAAFLAAHPDIDYAYAPNLVYDQQGESDRIHDQSAWRPGGTIECAPEVLFIRTMEWNDVFLQSMMIPKRCFGKIGLFSTALLRTQDYDMMLRLARVYRGASAGRPTVVVRNHPGARGPAAHRHDEKDRYVVWHGYEKQIFRRLRGELALAEYLPRGPDTPAVADLSCEQRVAALLQRCRIMFARGLLEEGAADARLLFDEPGFDDRSLARLAKLLTKTANIGDRDYIVDAPVLARGLAGLLDAEHGRVVVDAAMRGFYWALRRSLRKRQLKDSICLTHALALLVSFRTRRIAAARAVANR